MMSRQDVKRTLDDIERELADLERRRAEIDRAIARLQRVAGWLRQRATGARTPASKSRPKPSLTAYCRAALRMHAPRGLTPREVRDVLATAGVDWRAYSNGQAALHTVLKRLVQQQEATVTVDKAGDTRYAVRQVRAIALDRTDLEDDAFLERVLTADTPEAIEAVVKEHQRKPRQA